MSDDQMLHEHQKTWHGFVKLIAYSTAAVAVTLGSGFEPVLAAAMGTQAGGPPALVMPTVTATAETGLNFLRLLGWMNLIVIPLVVVALRPWTRLPPTFRMLAIGILIAVLASLFLAPGRQEGWGFGHLHGHLGSFVLLAAFGWARLASSKPHLRPDLNRAVGLCCAAAPVHDQRGRVVAALSVSAPAFRLDPTRLEQAMAPAVIRAAEGLSRSLGHPGGSLGT